MDWTSWSVSDWSKALVSYIFFDTHRLRTPISRINASDRFLIACTGDGDAMPGHVRRAFVSAFGTTAEQVKSHFEWTPSIPAKTAQLGFPPSFAALYLSLLAASADEATYNEGNFRERFKEIVKPVEITNLDFQGLPLLWKHVERWSQARATQSGDCRILRLPDPLHERRIGYSKRLAFPAYKDERRLHDILGQRGLSGDCDFRIVASAITSCLSMFSVGFKEEFDSFAALVARARFQQAYDSPLWGAVRDVGWEYAETRARSSGTFCLGVDVADPCYPQLYLLVDGVGREHVNGKCIVKKGLVGSAPEFIASPTDGKPWTAESLLYLGAQVPRLRALRLWKALDAGCVVFFRDQYGNMTSSAEHVDGSAACFLANGKLAKEILRNAKAYGLKSRSPIGGVPLRDWRVFFFEEISNGALTRLIECLPEEVQSVAGFGWRPPRPVLAGGAWYGQALLLNPASNPFVRMDNATSGTYELLGHGNAVLRQGMLEDTEDGFRIPPKDLAAGDLYARVRFVLGNDQVGEEAALVVTLASSLPLPPPLLLAEPTSWLVDGPIGKLANFADMLGDEFSIGNGRVTMKDKRPALHASPRLEVIGHGHWVNDSDSAIEDYPLFWEWLCEALCLRFQRCTTLPFKELDLHVRGAAEAADIPLWVARKLVLVSGWLIRIQRKSSPFAVYAPAQRTIALYRGGENPVARVTGMISHSERARLAASLRPGESAALLICKGDVTSIGAIELQLSAADRVQDLARDFQFTELGPSAFKTPLAPASALQGVAKFNGLERLPSTGLEAWNAKAGKWETHDPTAPRLTGTIIREEGPQRKHYHVFGGSAYWKTDSVVWAFLFRLTAVDEPIGSIAVNGDCRIHRSLLQVPPSLIRWWLHLGGGRICIDQGGSIVLGGGRGETTWTMLDGWIHDSGTVKSAPAEGDLALERRKLALRLREARSRRKSK